MFERPNIIGKSLVLVRHMVNSSQSVIKVHKGAENIQRCIFNFKYRLSYLSYLTGRICGNKISQLLQRYILHNKTCTSIRGFYHSWLSLHGHWTVVWLRQRAWNNPEAYESKRATGKHMEVWTVSIILGISTLMSYGDIGVSNRRQLDCSHKKHARANNEENIKTPYFWPFVRMTPHLTKSTYCRKRFQVMASSCGKSHGCVFIFCVASVLVSQWANLETGKFFTPLWTAHWHNLPASAEPKDH